MSAFLCSDLHTVAVAYIVASIDGVPNPARVLPIARALRKVNNRALFCRYGDRPQYIRARGFTGLFNDASQWVNSHNCNDIAGIIRCLHYQCSEGNAMGIREASFIDEALKFCGETNSSSVWSI